MSKRKSIKQNRLPAVRPLGMDLSKNEQEFLEWEKHLRQVACATFGISESELIAKQKTPEWLEPFLPFLIRYEHFEKDGVELPNYFTKLVFKIPKSMYKMDGIDTSKLKHLGVTSLSIEKADVHKTHDHSTGILNNVLWFAWLLTIKFSRPIYVEV